MFVCCAVIEWDNIANFLLKLFPLGIFQNMQNLTKIVWSLFAAISINVL